jgi:hypothetical protein
MKRSRLIGYDARETVSMVSDVLDFLVDYHLREAHSETTPQGESGMVSVLQCAIDALRIQASELDPALKREAANAIGLPRAPRNAEWQELDD